MDSSSCIEIVSKALDEIYFGSRFPGDIEHISPVERYISNFQLYSNSRLVSSARLLMAESWLNRSTAYQASFTQDLEEFFRVPRPEQLIVRDDTLKKHELLAVFINVLLQLLYYKVDLHCPRNDRIESLEKELRFLLTILGDTPFLSDELQQVQTILAEFEAVANQAGSFVHSYIFSMDPVVIEIIDERIGFILSLNLLKDKIPNLLRLVAKANTTPSRAAVGSLFIVDSFLHDLEDQMNSNNNQVLDVKDQIKTLHEELSQLKCINVGVGSPYLGIEEQKEGFVQTRDVAYEAEYLINTFLHEGCPLWYFSIRMTQVIDNIKLIVSRCQEIKRNYGTGAPKIAKELTRQQSLQTKRDPGSGDDTIVVFEEEKTYILDKLDGGTENLQIISIVGMPGLGKTTLAKQLYNDHLVIHKFDTRIWCVVSQKYERKGLLGNILISLSRELGKDEILNMQEGKLVEHIYKSLKGRRYLIVVDDIWSPNAWDNLRVCFPDDKNGSRILFTSRNKDAVPPGSIVNSLPLLSLVTCQILEAVGEESVPR